MSDILRDSPIGNLWHRVSISWFISFLLAAIALIPAIPVLQIDMVYLGYVAAIALGGALSLWMVGNIININPQRVLTFVLILAAFGVIPLLLTMAIVGFGFFIFAQDDLNLQIYLRLLLMIVTIIWCTYQLLLYRRRIVDRHFIEKEFLIGHDKILLHRPPKINLDAPSIENKTLLGYFYFNVVPYLVLVIPFAYPLQKIIFGTGGASAVFFVYAVLLGPLTIYSLGRLTCGTYLYVYKVWQLERKYGKPVMFDSND